MKAVTKRAIKRAIAIALLILGSYYLLVAAGIIPSQVVFFGFYPNAKTLAISAIILIAMGLLLDDRWRSKIKNALS